MATVFLSYSRDDAARLAVLAEDIKSLGHVAWLDQELTGGQRWWDHILDEIRDCDIFVSAVSASSMDSRACLAEYEYAVALGKPILPVMVENGVTDSLMPPALSQLQRINYIEGDKAAFAALNRALGVMRAAPPLPDPLPPPPPVPASYLFDLKTEIDSPGAMPPETQAQLVRELRARLSSGHSHADVGVLVHRFRQRDDLLVRTDQELTALAASLDQPTQPRPQPRPTTAAPPAPSMPHAAATNTPAAPPVSTASPQGGEVPLLWWAAPILGGLIGGAIAYFAVRDANPTTARNLLIAGGVMSLIWAAMLV